jgi:hypothetical protein
MRSDFLHRIVQVLSSPADQQEDGYHCLSQWNVELEEFVQEAVQQERHPSETISIADDRDSLRIDHDSVILIFASLRTTLLAFVAGKTRNEAKLDIIDGNQRQSDRDPSQYDWSAEITSEKIQWADLCVILRTAKNFWRWYIQLYLPLRRQYPVKIQERITRQDVETPWRSKQILEVLLNLLEKIFAISLTEQHIDSDCLRQGPHYVTQLFFYVTFPLTPNDLNLMDAYHYLITECNLMYRFLTLLSLHDSSMQLRLAIIRNVHNALVSFPQQSMKSVSATSIEISSKLEESSLVHWINYKVDIKLTFKTLLRDLAVHILTYSDDGLSAKEDNNNNSREINGELIVEILRCCYALKIGSELDNDQKWQIIIDKVLQFDAESNVHVLDRKLAITCILMESTTFRKYLSSSAVESLLQILEIQATDVLNERYIDDRAAAALNPILAVLYKSCVERPESCAKQVRKKVFPDDVSDEEPNDNLIAPTESPRNMSPIDAPNGTLRWKLIQLLTWPNSFVKRLTGELLFLLCHNSQQEFIRRVGIGNAVAILSLKGLIDLPADVHS